MNRVFDIFFPDRDAHRKSHLKNLISVAMADGRFGFREYRLIYAMAFKLGLTKEDIRAVKSNPSKVRFTPPRKYKDRMKHAYDLVRMVIIDKKIKSKEVALCKALAFQMDLLPKVIDDMIYHLTVQRKAEISMVVAR